MTRMRLTEKHPLWLKLNKLLDCMDELELTLIFEGGRCFIFEKKNPIRYEILDIEDEDGRIGDYHRVITSFPYETEFKIVYNKGEKV